MRKQTNTATSKKLIGTFEKIARAMTNNYAVKVVPSANCSTDGNTIQYPVNADHFDSATQSVLNGWLDHEVGHIIEEKEHEQRGQAGALKLMNRNLTNTERLLLNAFEDIRMERKMSDTYPGVSDNLRATGLHATELLRARYAGEGIESANFWHVLGCGIVCQAQDADTSWVPAAYAPYMGLVADEIAAANTASCASDCLELGRSVIKKVEEKLEELKEEQEKRQDEEKDEAEGDEENGEAEGGEEKDEDSGGEGGEDNQPQGGDEGNSEDSGSEVQEMSDGDLAKAIEAGENKEESEYTDLVAAVSEALNTANTEQETTLEYRVAKHVKDEWITPPASQHRYNNARATVARQIKGMRNKLTALLSTRSNNSVAFGQTEGELDGEELWSVEAGNKRVFTQDVEGEAFDTAVTVLIDLSGSMGSHQGSNSWHAQCAAIGLGETLDALNCPLEIIGFHTVFESHIREANPTRNQRNDSITYEVFKAFDEKYKRVRSRLGTISGAGVNVDHEAVMEASKRLAERPERRKLLIVISDGQPNDECVKAWILSDMLRKTVKQVTSAGIEVIGFGMRTDVDCYYNESTGATSVRIDDMNRFAVSVYRVLKQRFLKGRRQGR